MGCAGGVSSAETRVGSTVTASRTSWPRASARASLDLLAQPGLELVAGELLGDRHDERGAVQGEGTRRVQPGPLVGRHRRDHAAPGPGQRGVVDGLGPGAVLPPVVRTDPVVPSGAGGGPRRSPGTCSLLRAASSVTGVSPVWSSVSTQLSTTCASDRSPRPDDAGGVRDLRAPTRKACGWPTEAVVPEVQGSVGWKRHGEREIGGRRRRRTVRRVERNNSGRTPASSCPQPLGLSTAGPPGGLTLPSATPYRGEVGLAPTGVACPPPGRPSQPEPVDRSRSTTTISEHSVSKRTFQPNNRRRHKTHGFRLRMRTRAGRSHPRGTPPQGPHAARRLSAPLSTAALDVLPAPHRLRRRRDFGVATRRGRRAGYDDAGRPPGPSRRPTASGQPTTPATAGRLRGERGRRARRGAQPGAAAAAAPCRRPAAPASRRRAAGAARAAGRRGGATPHSWPPTWSACSSGWAPSLPPRRPDVPA